MNNTGIIKIGTRGSKLAIAQTNLVIDEIKNMFPDLQCEIIVINTLGDKILNKPLLEFGGKGVFVSEFEEALQNNQIDIAIHSSKDMPMELAEGLEIAGVLKREDPRDVLLTLQSNNLDNLDKATIGTSSLRRQYQMEQLYPNIECNNLRGNVTTRISKLREGIYDGIILAAAGIKRLLLDNQPDLNYRYFDYKEMVPAGGQGIIAIQTRKDSNISQIIKKISNQKAYLELEIERKALHLFQAGCHEPIGVIAQIIDNSITIYMMKEIQGNLVKQIGTDDIQNRERLLNHLVDNILEER